MCKLKKYKGRSSNPELDECMERFIQGLNYADVKTLASCCGHNKYPMTVIVKGEYWRYPIELMSFTIIERKRRFYKRDKQGYYYIPEILLKKQGRIKSKG